MRAGISGISLHGVSRRGGFWEYFKTLVKILSEVNMDEEIFIFIHKKVLEEFKDINNTKFHFIEVKVPERGSHYTEFFILPLYLKKYKINILHFPTFAVPLFSRIPYIVTVHDLAFLKVETNLKKRDLFYWRNIFRLSVKRASLIISDSENTRKDLIFHWKIPHRKIEVLPPFSSILIHESGTMEKEVLEKYNIETPFYLFIGTLEPRKNLRRVISAFLKAKEKLPSDIRLVIIGQKGWESREVLNKIYENRSKIIWLNNISQEELPSFYANAIALLYPSLYEGFGLPILEAYKFQTPVITSNISSLPEVAGKGALFVNPYNVEEIERAILEIYFNRELRESLLREQKKELAKYNYKKVGEKILSLYRNLL